MICIHIWQDGASLHLHSVNCGLLRKLSDTLYLHFKVTTPCKAVVCCPAVVVFWINVQAIYDAKSEEIGPGIYRFKAEIGTLPSPSCEKVFSAVDLQLAEAGYQ